MNYMQKEPYHSCILGHITVHYGLKRMTFRPRWQATEGSLYVGTYLIGIDAEGRQ